MANPVIGELVQEVSETTTIMESATVLINGFRDRLAAGIAAALANGATAAELEPLTTMKTELDTKGNALAAAVEANTGT
jgi:hypothetical protein